MRPSVFSAAALATAVLLLGACNDSKSPQSQPAASASANASPAASPVPGGKDKVSICAAYNQAQDQAQAKLVEVLPKVTAVLNDPGKAGPALAELKALVAAFGASLSAQVNLAQDADLKAAIQADVEVLRKTGDQIAAAGNDAQAALAALQTDDFTALGEKVTAVCEK